MGEKERERDNGRVLIVNKMKDMSQYAVRVGQRITRKNKNQARKPKKQVGSTTRCVLLYYFINLNWIFN